MSENIPALERIRFFDGQLLTAEDLIALDNSNRQLRWLHNRALHNWGIGIGFDVQGNRGDTAVTVQPGFAIDALGREVISLDTRKMPIPAVPGGPGGTEASYYLVAFYRDDAHQAVEERRDGVCAAGGSVRLGEAAGMAWKTAAQVAEGIDLILARIWIQNCVLSRPASAAPRRLALASCTPYMAAGVVAFASVKLAPWQIGALAVGYSATIDTSAARFQTMPRYMTQIIGERASSSAGQQFLIAESASVFEPARDRFTLRIALQAQAAKVSINPSFLLDAKQGPATLSKLGWQVAWMGIEG